MRHSGFDPVRFCIEVVGIAASWQQAELLEAVALPGARVSVSSGRGCFAAGIRAAKLTHACEATPMASVERRYEAATKIMMPIASSSRP
ncbi:hypothetical protein R69746_07690 [Paraburkholderia aspalathi]|nr:hypothetical protein R69746_07690 [Paraburkholderia aspalathi]